VAFPNQIQLNPSNQIQIVEVIAPGPQGPAGPGASAVGGPGAIQYATPVATFTGSTLFTVDPALGMTITGGLFITGALNLQVKAAPAQVNYLLSYDPVTGEVFSTTSSIGSIKNGDVELKITGSSSGPVLILTSGSNTLFTVNTASQVNAGFLVLEDLNGKEPDPVAGGIYYSSAPGQGWFLGV
jgi:hypothetical protein